MCNSFSNVWKRRTSTHSNDQTQLYITIKNIFNRSTVCLSIHYQEREDFFQDFYIKKIMHGLKTGLAISTPHYDEMSIGALLHMMKQFKGNYYKQKKSPITMPIDQAIQNSYTIRQDLQQIEASHLTETESCKQYPLDNMIEHAIHFINASEEWIYILILKSATDGSVNLLEKNANSKHYHWRSKLGLILKGSYYNGAISADEYHEKTLIGQWSVQTYGIDIIPFSEGFLSKIFKSLHLAALSIYIQDKKSRL